MYIGGFGFKREETIPENGLLSSILSHYSFSSDATDDVGTYNGTATNVTYDSSVKVASATHSAQFNGSSSYISALNTNMFNGASNFTLSLWARFDNLTGVQYIDAITSSSSPFVQFYMLTDGSTFKFGGNDGTIRAVQTTLTAGQWHHIVCMKTSSGLKLILDDSTPITEPNCTGTTVSIADTSDIGRRHADGTRYFDGRLCLYGRRETELTGEQITTLNNGGSGLAYADFTY